MITYLTAFFILLGCLLMFIAGLGIFRLPDIYMRLHSSSKVPSLGIGLLLIAAILNIGDIATITQSAIIIIFIFLTAPVGAHMLARAAYFRHIPQWKRFVADEGKGMVDVKRHYLGTPKRFSGHKTPAKQAPQKTERSEEK